MPYIFSNERDEDCLAAFKRYRDYLESVKHSSPPSAFALASSEWYFDANDHKCPHDGWLESFTFSESATGDRSEQRITSLRVRLIAAYHDGIIEFVYPQVFNYSLKAPVTIRGLGDWRYDEFRLSPDGNVIHEIEWAGFPHEENAHWIIEASDVEFQWIPR